MPKKLNDIEDLYVTDDVGRKYIPSYILAEIYHRYNTFKDLLAACKFSLSRFESIAPNNEYSVRIKLEAAIVAAEKKE